MGHSYCILRIAKETYEGEKETYEGAKETYQ
jgi:hypothetical protein